jgi:hypothetical protein
MIWRAAHLKNDLLPAATAGGTLLNDTKGLHRKLFNCRLEPLFCNSSFSCDEPEIEALPEQIDPVNPYDNLIPHPETYLGSAPGDPLAHGVKNEKIKIDRGDTYHTDHERLLQLHQESEVPDFNDRSVKPMRLPGKAGKVFDSFQANRFALSIRSNPFGRRNMLAN